MLPALLLGLPLATMAQVEKGKASYYADKLHGRPTSSGEPYDKKALTAAHRTHEFGTMLKITNLKNGKVVQVRVNDRGPHTKDRVIDISKAAAIAIDLIRDGIAVVTVELADDKSAIDVNAVAVEPPDLVGETRPLAQSPVTTPFAPDTAASSRFLASIGLSGLEQATTGKALFLTGGTALAAEAELSAFHPGVPAGSYLHVTNLENGSEVVVLVKGAPQKSLPPGYLLLLGNAPASILGVNQQPEARLQIKHLPYSAALPVPSASKVATTPAAGLTASALASASVGTYSPSGLQASPQGLGVQTGSYRDAQVALDKANELLQLQFGEVYIQSGWQSGQKVYRLLVGSFQSRQQAEPLVSFLKKAGIKAFPKEHFEPGK